MISKSRMMDFFVDFGERSLRGVSSTASFLRYNNHICYITNLNKVIMWFRCASCDNFLDEVPFKATFNEL